MYQIVFYTTERGDSPIDEFLDGLEKKARAKVEAHMKLLEEQGPNLRRPYADVVSGKIRELRVLFGSNQYRILYFFFQRRQIVAVHGFMKKRMKIKEGDVEMAQQRMADWIRRHPTEEEK